MTDRELLELAAKAAGIKHVDYTGIDYDGRHGFELVGEWGRHIGTWNPLNDDGDALRLAVDLGVRINFVRSGNSIPHVSVYFKSKVLIIESEPDNGTMQAATRRAIVRAAAEICKNL